MAVLNKNSIIFGYAGRQVVARCNFIVPGAPASERIYSQLTVFCLVTVGRPNNFIDI